MVERSEGDPADRSAAFQETVAQIADREADLEETADGILESVAAAAGTDYATLSSVHLEAGRYVFERVVHPPDSDLEPGLTEPISHLPNCARVVETEETLVLSNVPDEAPELDHPAWGIESYVGAPVVVDDDIYGTCCFFDVESRDVAFPDWTVDLVEYVAEWLGGALQRHNRLERLDRRCERSTVVREAAVKAIEADGREALAAAVCRRLAARDGYRAAWMGEPDPGNEALRLHGAAGLDRTADGLPIDLEDISGRDAPGARALETGEIQVARTATAGDDKVDRRAGAVIGVPLSAVGATRGALVVRADDPDAFEGSERRALADLGRLLGHAVTAAERERVLTGETVVRLDLKVREALPVTDPPAVRIDLQDVACLNDGSVVGFGEVEADSLGAARDLVSSIGFVDRLNRRGQVNGDTAIELVADRLPAVSAAHARSGAVERAVLDGADLRARIVLPSDAEARRLVDHVTDDFPRTDVLSKREVDREDPAIRRPPVPDTLTDRQLDAMRTAYVLGYYEHPRAASGADVAEALGVAPATFSQHRRAAEQKLLGAVFDDSSE